MEALLSPGGLSASTSQVPLPHVLTFTMALTTLHLNICLLTHFSHLTLSDLLSHL